VQIHMGCCPAGHGRGRDAHELGDRPSPPGFRAADRLEQLEARDRVA
jgi:hypothetical protein